MSILSARISLSALLLLLFTSKINCDCVQSSFSEARLYICAGKCIRQTVSNCVDGDSFIGDVKHVSFQGTKVPHCRRGFFKDLPALETVSLLTMDIKRLSPQAFLNTPKIRKADFTFNFLEEIPWGVFNDMSFEELKFDWNSIRYIEEEAFSNMPNLTRLLFTRNQLDKFLKSWFKNSPNLELIVLSYNNIGNIYAFSFESFPHLQYLDLSFNQILKFDGAFVAGQSLELLDLTRNNMTALSMRIFPSEGFSVKELRVPLNRLSFLSTELLNRASVQVIGLHPNPWQCPCLDSILDWAFKNKRTIREPIEDFRIKANPSLPVCAFKVKNPDDCVLKYDEEFLSTQDKYFELVYYPNSIWEKPTSEAPNFDVLQIDNTFANFSNL